MAFEFTSNLGPCLAATELGIRRGLIAAAELYAGDVRKQLEHGYTTGAFVTGNAANSVQRGDPEVTGDGGAIAVGSTQVDPPYLLFWEVGHVNAWTRKFERVEIWVPTLLEHRERYYAALAEEVRLANGGA
jgi:hypothetical protein